MSNASPIIAPDLDLESFGALALDAPELGAGVMENTDRAPLDADPDPRIVTRIESRRMVELAMRQSAAQGIGTLPGPGEAIHWRMVGSYNGIDILPALLDLLAPTTIAELHLASLSFNRRVAERLLEHIDAGAVGRCVFLVSSMFQGKEKHLTDWLAQELSRRGSRLCVARNHCKLLLASTTDNRHLVIEGSHNLRTCACWEQCTLVDDAALHRWHAAFIERHGEAGLTSTPAPISAPVRAHSQKRAGLGVLSVSTDPSDRAEMIGWKTAGHEDAASTRRYAVSLAALIRQWCPTLPVEAVVTTPPQGASTPGHYFARSLARSVAALLEREYRDTLTRTDTKRHHHPMASLQQAPYQTGNVPSFVIVVDDLITSGATMRLSLSALRDAGAAAFGFAYAGC